MSEPTVTRRVRWLPMTAAALALALAACQPATPPPRVSAPAATKPAPATPAAAAPAAPAAATPGAKVVTATALPSMDLPPGPLYSCVVAGSRTAIEYAESVEKLCRRHPEMGPCQYERDACRKGGGRVYTAKGEEVTMSVEAAYDAKVQRVRFQADGAPTKR